MSRIILDDFFKDLFQSCFETPLTDKRINDIDVNINFLPEEVMFDLANIITTCNVMGSTFAQLHSEVTERIINNKDVDSELVNKAIICIVIKYLNHFDPTYTEEYYRGPRNFRKEVVAQKLGKPMNEITDEEVEDVLAKNDSLYSITDEPIGCWDEYFFNICRQVARHSKCLSRRIGAVLVSDKSIVSTGYNGPPRGIPRCDERWVIDPGFITKYGPQVEKEASVLGVCPRYVLGAKSGEMLNICTAAHAEENAILNAAWHGIRTKGTTLYMTCGMPCHRCLVKIINAGITEIVVTGISFYDDNSEFLLNNSNIKVRLYNFK